MAIPPPSPTTGARTEPPALEIELLRENELGEMWSLFTLANHFLFPMYARFEETHGVTRPEFVILFALYHFNHLIAQEISGLFSLPKNSISRGVSRLTAKKLVASQQDPLDRRRIILAMTGAGRRLLEVLLDTATERRRRMIAPLTAAERRELQRLLLKMADGVGARLDPPVATESTASLKTRRNPA